ncbi:uncharacterized protein [Nicotiana sylvestris]|uniref:uncharacterized protein isoform X2 n=1 Tax=Nicotiana sylvestris TaxID=4096 RepID=UPI00388CD17A
MTTKNNRLVSVDKIGAAAGDDKVCVRMRRIRISGGGNSALLGTSFPFSNYTKCSLKPKSFLKLFPSTTTPIFTTLHYRLITSAQHSSPSSHAHPTPQTELLISSGDGPNGYPMKDSKVVLKGMRYAELEKWVQSHGYRPAQALMLWKRLYGNNINIWALSQKNNTKFTTIANNQKIVLFLEFFGSNSHIGQKSRAQRRNAVRN